MAPLMGSGPDMFFVGAELITGVEESRSPVGFWAHAAGGARDERRLPWGVPLAPLSGTRSDMLFVRPLPLREGRSRTPVGFWAHAAGAARDERWLPWGVPLAPLSGARSDPPFVRIAPGGADGHNSVHEHRVAPAVRDHFSEVIDRVEFLHERVVVTRNGHAAAVLISPDDLAELEETLDVLSDPEALADIREADAAYARGDVVRGVDAVRQLRA